MEITDRLNAHAYDLLEEARRFRAAAHEPGSHVDAPDALASLEEALQTLSAAWYQLAADARVRLDGLPREQEVRLMGTLHDVAAAFARCARVSRNGRSEVAPMIDRAIAGAPT
jgi:hypothetical protein